MCPFWLSAACLSTTGCALQVFCRILLQGSSLTAEVTFHTSRDWSYCLVVDAFSQRDFLHSVKSDTMSIGRVLCCLLLTCQLTEGKRTKPNRTGERVTLKWSSTRWTCVSLLRLKRTFECQWTSPQFSVWTMGVLEQTKVLLWFALAKCYFGDVNYKGLSQNVGMN